MIKLPSYTSWQQKGFTLIEAIVSLVLLGILGAMLTTFGGKLMTNSLQPAFQAQQAYNLQQSMESITVDYEKFMLNESDPLCTLATVIKENPGNMYGNYTATIRFLTVSNPTSATPTLITTNVSNCVTDNPRILEVTLTSPLKNTGVSISNIFTVPDHL